MKNNDSRIWPVSGMRTPFAKIDRQLSKPDAIESSLPVIQSMTRQGMDLPDFIIRGTAAPNLAYINITREIWLDSGIDPAVPHFSTIMACRIVPGHTFGATGAAIPVQTLKQLSQMGRKKCAIASIGADGGVGRVGSLQS